MKRKSNRLNRPKSFEYFVLEKIVKKDTIVAVVRANSGTSEAQLLIFPCCPCGGGGIIRSSSRE
ncbi:hypothetical protein EBZ39_05795 [bacterium]|nr:hypothetical protein [bacterium]